MVLWGGPQQEDRAESAELLPGHADGTFPVSATKALVRYLIMVGTGPITARPDRSTHPAPPGRQQQGPPQPQAAGQGLLRATPTSTFS